MRVAALDLGTNTSLLLIVDVNDQQIEKIYCDESQVTRLGQGVQATGMFHVEALERMDRCLSEYAELIRQHQAQKIIAVATSAARDVSNGEKLMAIGRKHGIPIVTIPGEQEAKLTFLGATQDFGSSEGSAVIDVGGGSTEIIGLTKGKIIGQSVNVGSVRLTEKFVSRQPIPQQDIEAIDQWTMKEFQRVKHLLPTKPRKVIAVAGTPTTLAALQSGQEFDELRVHASVLSEQQITNWIQQLATMSVQERERLPGMQPQRADVIVTGAIVLRAGMRICGVNQITVSVRGVRYGVAQAWQEF